MSTYNWNAKDYAKHSQSQLIWAKELIRKLELKGSEDVLDIGCGDGKVTAEIASLVSKGTVLGIDSSDSMINLAVENYKKSIYPNLTFRVMDARLLSYENQFDVVFSNAALHWVKNHHPVLESIYKGLRASGKIFLQMGGKGNAEGILSVLDELTYSTEWQPYFQNFEFPYGFYDVKEYSILLTESGFNIQRIELIPKDMIYDRISKLEGWIRTTWLPYTERIPEERRDQFIKTISTKYIEKNPPVKTGKIRIPMIRLEVTAEKI